MSTAKFDTDVRLFSRVMQVKPKHKPDCVSNVSILQLNGQDESLFSIAIVRDQDHWKQPIAQSSYVFFETLPAFLAVMNKYFPSKISDDLEFINYSSPSDKVVVEMMKGSEEIVSLTFQGAQASDLNALKTTTFDLYREEYDALASILHELQVQDQAANPIRWKVR